LATAIDLGDIVRVEKISWSAVGQAAATSTESRVIFELDETLGWVAVPDTAFKPEPTCSCVWAVTDDYLWKPPTQGIKIRGRQKHVCVAHLFPLFFFASAQQSKE
jgi:hypothetical protein